MEAGKKYVFSYQMKNSSAVSNDSYIRTSLSATTAEDESNYNDMFGAVSCGTDWTNVSYEFTVPEGKNYLVFSARWLKSSKSFDNFYLCEVLADPTTEGNVDFATAAIPTANIGTGAFQYSQDAIDAANALVQGTATVEDVEAAYSALQTINEPTDGQLFNVILTYGGWTYDQKAMTYMAGDRNDMGGYNIKYQAAANTNLAQAFTFTKVEGNNYKMSQIDADGNVRYISTGVPYSGNANQIRTTTTADDAMIVTVIPTATEGVWNLKNVAADNYIGSQDAGVFTVNSHIDFNIVETSKPSITINTTAAGWGTTILPFAVSEIPTDVKVYSCAEASGTTLTLVEVTALEANKPYIIEGAWEETLTGDAQGTALTYTNGLLTGVYVSTPAILNTYILQKQDENVAFFKVETEGITTIGANRAYLTAPTSGARAFYLGGDATAIGALKALTSGDAEIYDVNGLKQVKLQKGVNIIKTKDGRTQKVMVK